MDPGVKMIQYIYTPRSCGEEDADQDPDPKIRNPLYPFPRGSSGGEDTVLSRPLDPGVKRIQTILYYRILTTSLDYGEEIILTTPLDPGMERILTASLHPGWGVY
jgi:hypothetical protein